MTVTPFDKTYETPDEFSERLARNQQLLLALTPDELSRMETCSRAAGRRVFPILQLRLHPEIERLKRMVDCAPPRQFMM